jgi:hypothetical protein
MMRAASYFPREVAAAVHAPGVRHLNALMERLSELLLERVNIPFFNFLTPK